MCWAFLEQPFITTLNKMKMTPFKLENFFNKWEFRTPYLLCSSDNETFSMKELLALADEETLALWENLNLGYTPVSGHPLLKQELASLYENINDKGICTFAGAGEALFAVLNVLLQPGDHVIAPFPCYQTLSDLPKDLGADVSLYSLVKDEGKWTFQADDLIQLIRPNTRLIIINFPHNPTGVHIDASTLQVIAEHAKSCQAYLLSDEVYRFSEHNSESVLPPAADLYEKAISIGVMSKTFGLAGVRIGWLATQEEQLLQKVQEFKCYTSICNSAPSEILSIIALRAREIILERNLNIIRENLDLLDLFFQKYSHLFSWKRPQAGSTAFPELLQPIPIESFVEDLIAKQGVLLLPGSVYSFPGNHFRLGFGKRTMNEALDRLEIYIKQHPLA